MITTKIDYTKNYLKIYFWKFLSILTGFLSLLIVVPHLSSDKEIFGIYSLCVSLTIYLSYADIGFLSAGQKYAAEAFVKNDKKAEIEILGFTAAILLLMIIPFSLAMIYLSFNPENLISNISVNARDVSSSIFLILALMLPIQIIIQRLVQSILIIRIKDYISMRIDVFFNIIKIVSVFHFFSTNSYRIVDYYLFITLISIISSFVILIIIKVKEEYDFLFLLKSIRLRKKEFNITKKLALSSLLLSVGWLIYHEFDLIIIGKLFGAEEIAIYAVGFTFLNFLRNLWNSIFTPFAQRFNHFVGLDNDFELKKLIKLIIDYTFPLCIVVTLVLLLSSEKIIYYWVGPDYKDSILILQILILGSLFGFVTNPSSYYLTAKTKYIYLNFIGISLPVIFITGVLLLIPSFNLLAIPMTKSFTIFFAFIIYFIGIRTIYNPIISIKKWFYSLSLICIIISLLTPYILNIFFISQQKSSINLIYLLITITIIILVSYFILLFSRKEQRNDLKIILSSLKKIN